MRKTRVALLLCAVCASFVVAAGANAAKNETILVSRVGSFGPGGDSSSDTPSVSADGRFVAFESDSDNLSVHDNNAVTNVFVRDLVQNTTTLASLPTGTDGTLNNGFSFNPSISADGRFVAFDSDSDNLSDQDNNAVTNVFVRDLVQSTTTLASLPTGTDGTLNNGFSFNPSISADGRFVAFDSASDNLSDQDNNGFNVFVRDLAQSTTTLASLPTGTDGTLNNADSFNPSISADGRFVAFRSGSDNLSDQDNNGVSNVFVRDLALNTTTLASLPTGTDGTLNNGNSLGPSISADGRFVAFESDSDNLSDQDNDASINVFIRDVRGPQPDPALSIDDVSLTEGNVGTKFFRFNVWLDGVPPTPVTVDVVTIDRSATSPADYAFRSTTLRFAPGQHKKVFSVPVRGDRRREASERFLVRLQGARGAPVEDGAAIGTIRNDDR